MNVLITGASSGIGCQAALLLAGEGHVVFAIARNKGNLEKLQAESLTLFPKSHLHIVAGDITDNNFIAEIKKEVSSKAGALHILINNAGLLVNKPFEELTAQDWQSVYSTNVFAPVNLIKHLFPLFSSVKNETEVRAHILNIASMGGVQNSKKFKGLSAYSSSKAALIGITECLAEEFADKNIAVNCLALGSSQTEMFSNAFPQFKAATSAKEMASFVARFATEGQKLFNGKVIPVSNSTP